MECTIHMEKFILFAKDGIATKYIHCVKLLTQGPQEGLRVICDIIRIRTQIAIIITHLFPILRITLTFLKNYIDNL